MDPAPLRADHETVFLLGLDENRTRAIEVNGRVETPTEVAQDLPTGQRIAGWIDCLVNPLDHPELVGKRAV